MTLGPDRLDAADSVPDGHAAETALPDRLRAGAEPIPPEEDASRESDARFRLLFESMVEGYAYCRMLFEDGRPHDFVYLQTNARFSELTGLRNVVGRRISEIVPGIRETDPELFERYGRVALTGEPERFETYLAALDMWLSISVYCPTPEHFVAVFDVITERKRAEEALRSSEARLAEAQAVAKMGSWEADLSTLQVLGSEQLGRICGLAGKNLQLPHTAFLALVHPDDRARVETAFGASLDSPSPTHAIEHRIVTAEGMLRWVEERWWILRDDRRQPVRAVGTCQDITERKLAADLMQVHVSLLHYAVDHSLEEVMQRTLDEVGMFLDSPIGFYHFVGADQQTLTLKAWSTRTEREFCRAEGKGMSYAVDKAGVWVDCVHTRRPVIHNDYASLPHRKGLPEGHAPVIRELVVPVIRADRVVAILGVGNKPHDYTDEDAAVTQHLADVVWEITERSRAEELRARLEEQLQQAQKMESVGRLAGGVAHDLNNMLAVIMGHAELALEQVAPAQPLHADLAGVLTAAKRSADLVHQLLAFARKQPIAPKVLDLNEAVGGALGMLRRMVGEDVRLEWVPGADLGPVRVDPVQVVQVLINLCANARDAIADVGTITMATAAGLFDDAERAAFPGVAPGACVRLRVTDDGCGMDAGTRTHLFEPFFTTKGVGKGTGLGLASVYGSITQNGGTITVRSEPGAGTTFTIAFPRHDGSVAADSGSRGAEPATLGRETVLLVEDEPLLLSLAKAKLERQGYTVLEASAPGEALRLARDYAGPIHLLVTDVVMPEMNGRTLAERIEVIRPGLTRLFVSGYTDEVVVGHGVNGGAAFLQKPFSLDDLAAKVRAVLDQG